MENPWSALSDHAPYVLPDDRPYVEAWNEGWGAERERVRLHVEALPDPFVGPRDAPIVVLARNPGWAGTELDDLAEPKRAASLLGNLGDDEERHVHSYLTDVFAATAGGRWWRKTMRTVMEAASLRPDDLARRVLAVEFHGYHSQDWATLPVTLPSQWFAFDLVSRAVERGAVVVVLRGRRDWEVAVPALRGYPRAFRTNSVQTSAISPRNLRPEGFEAVVQAAVG
jgi:hypothetical protein